MGHGHSPLPPCALETRILKRKTFSWKEKPEENFSSSFYLNTHWKSAIAKCLRFQPMAEMLWQAKPWKGDRRLIPSQSQTYYVTLTSSLPFSWLQVFHLNNECLVLITLNSDNLWFDNCSAPAVIQDRSIKYWSWVIKKSVRAQSPGELSTEHAQFPGELPTEHAQCQGN